MIAAEEKQCETLQEATAPHVESFNFMLHEGLIQMVKEFSPVEFETPEGQRCSLYIQHVSVSQPELPVTNRIARTNKVFPAECRQRRATYHGDIDVQLAWTVDGEYQDYVTKTAGKMPIMVKSTACHLHNLSPTQLIKHGEEAEEMGGYYIVNGQEKVIRMLVLPRRNFPLCVKRPSWKTRGENFTEYGLTMRCVRSDQSAVNMTLHYADSGDVVVAFPLLKRTYYIPLLMVLKGLVDVEDRDIYHQFMEGKEEDSFFQGSVQKMMADMVHQRLFTQRDVLLYIGERFRVKMNVPEWYTHEQVGTLLLKQYICVHLEKNRDKFNMLLYMTRKLLVFANKKCCEESADNPMFQEVLLSGHLMLMMLKEKLEGWLNTVRNVVLKTLRTPGKSQLVKGTVTKALNFAPSLTRPLEYLLATGNLNSPSGLALMQSTGLSVVADRLNFLRFLSHFRSVHRGSYFTQMRTTEVRKLLPEAWGFICPVHTPDGVPCGLLNHLAANCQVVNRVYRTQPIVRVLASMGLYSHPAVLYSLANCYEVVLDGRSLGYLREDRVESVADYLRHCKVYNRDQIPPVLEVCWVPRSGVASQYPGLYLFTTPARLMRPVLYLGQQQQQQQEEEPPTELLGTFEQPYLHIALRADEIREGITKHMEVSSQTILSILANLSPFADNNPSPRNIYQCQMAKQTMGTPVHSFPLRADNKLYRLITPQMPVVRTEAYDDYNIDEYPVGTNAIVAVISATGYDMEDAIVINKASYERGFCQGCIYKSVVVDLPAMQSNRFMKDTVVFGCETAVEGLDSDGLPPVGRRLTPGSALYSYVNLMSGRGKVEVYSGAEEAYVDQVKVLGSDTGREPLNKVCIVLRIVRNPTIGDKFSSRHGQKGVCSMLWPQEDMPFTETGMVPDILFNPHGFPSRMTVGMMIEVMAGKSGVLHGIFHDASAFNYSEEDPAYTFFRECLRKSGYNDLGTEVMYCGETGNVLEVEIFMGVVYYQRLRHMVSDKFQVRTTGPVDPLTMQPVQGRKRMGGVRFGEMERDGLISHGTSFLLQDRLFNNSDRSLTHVCRECGNLLCTARDKAPSSFAAVSFEARRKWRCLNCERSDTVTTVAVPYALKYLMVELAFMNIKVKVDVK